MKECDIVDTPECPSSDWLIERLLLGSAVWKTYF